MCADKITPKQKAGPPSILFAHHPELGKKKIDFKLRVQGFMVENTNEAMQALHLMEKFPFDLILIDDQLKDMSGYELLLIIRGRWNQASLPVVIFTSDDDQDEMARVMDAGANHYLTKSQNINALLTLLKKELKIR